MLLRGKIVVKNHNPTLHFTWDITLYYCFLCHV